MSEITETARHEIAIFERVSLKTAESLCAENERLRAALHRISLASQNSMSSKDECGRIARAALTEKEGTHEHH